MVKKGGWIFIGPLGYLAEFVKIYNFVGHRVHTLQEASDHYVSPAASRSFRFLVPVRVAVGNCVFPNGDCGISQVGFISLVSGTLLDFLCMCVTF
jgi:hypothetical protein